MENHRENPKLSRSQETQSCLEDKAKRKIEQVSEFSLDDKKKFLVVCQQRLTMGGVDPSVTRVARGHHS